MINLTRLGGKYKLYHGNESVLVTVMKYNTSAVKLLLQRCSDSADTKRIVHRVIVDNADDTPSKLVGEQKQADGETDQLVIKRMEVSHFNGYNGRRSVEIKVDEYRYLIYFDFNLNYTPSILFRFPRSLAELANLHPKYRRCFSSTYLFKLAEHGKFKLSLTLHDCYRGWQIRKEFFQEDHKFRTYDEPR